MRLFLAPLLSLVGAAPLQAYLEPHSDTQVEFTVHNPTTEPLTVLKPGSPFVVDNSFPEAVTTCKFFEVLDSTGAPLPYRGAIVKFDPIGEHNWLEVPAGQNVSVVVELRKYFDMNANQQYTVREEQGAHLHTREFDDVPVSFESVTVESGRASTPVSFAPKIDNVQVHINNKTGLLGIQTSGCSSTSASKLDSARSYAKNAFSTGKNGRYNYDSAFVKFFGSVGSSDNGRSSFFNQWDSMSSAFNSRMYSSSFVVVCTSCSSNVFAYVYPNDPTRMYICDPFGLNWPTNAAPSSSESIGCTFAHEASHYNVVGDKDDKFYGYSNCINKAKTRPSDARINADSIAYYAFEVYNY
jgi:peptidyl-Lys metalloendopeptidase